MRADRARILPANTEQPTVSERTSENRAENPSPAPVDPRAEVAEVARQMFDRLLPIALVLGGAALVVASYRTLAFGWNWLIALYVAFFVLLVGTLSLQRRLQLTWVAVLVCGVGFADAVVGLWGYGLTSAGIVLLAASVVGLGALLGLRAGLVATGAGVLVLLGLAWAHHSGAAPLEFDVIAYVRSTEAWAVHIVHFVLASVLLHVVIHAIARRLAGSIGALQRRTAELESEVVARQAAERDLREREAQHQLLTEHMSEVLVQQDMNLRIVYVSPSIQRMFGYTVEEAKQLDMTKVMVPESLERALLTFAEAAQQANREPVEVASLEFEYIRKDGSTFWGELAAKFLYDADGVPTGTVGMVRDVTERRGVKVEQDRLHDQLRQAEKMQVLGQLAGGIAHDFNNQLTGIMGYSELLQTGRRDDPLVQDAAQAILQCAQRSRDLTAKLLAFARKAPQQLKPVDMHPVVREVAAILERSIDKNVKLHVELVAERSQVQGDPSALQNALLNLAINARDAMPEGGTITIQTEVIEAANVKAWDGSAPEGQGEYLAIRVRDTGVGLSPEAMGHLFEPFYTTKPVGKGTGLGLPAVHGTAVAHQGTVEVESQVGQGSTFSLLLPLDEGNHAQPLAPDVGVIPPGSRVLVVDDERSVREVVRVTLEQAGCEVVTAAEGTAAIELFRNRRGEFDLVLLDMVLPGMDGTKVFRALRFLRPEIKVLLVSGHSQPGAVEALLEEGALRLLRKPFSLAQLSSAVASALTRSPHLGSS